MAADRALPDRLEPDSTRRGCCLPSRARCWCCSSSPSAPFCGSTRPKCRRARPSCRRQFPPRSCSRTRPSELHRVKSEQRARLTGLALGRSRRRASISIPIDAAMRVIAAKGADGYAPIEAPPQRERTMMRAAPRHRSCFSPASAPRAPTSAAPRSSQIAAAPQAEHATAARGAFRRRARRSRAHWAPRSTANAAVLVFADYTCRTLCGPILAFAAGALENTGLTPGRDYHLIVVGIDPKRRPRVRRRLQGQPRRQGHAACRGHRHAQRQGRGDPRSGASRRLSLRLRRRARSICAPGSGLCDVTARGRDRPRVVRRRPRWTATCGWRWSTPATARSAASPTRSTCSATASIRRAASTPPRLRGCSTSAAR